MVYTTVLYRNMVPASYLPQRGVRAPAPRPSLPAPAGAAAGPGSACPRGQTPMQVLEQDVDGSICGFNTMTEKNKREKCITPLGDGANVMALVLQ